MEKTNRKTENTNVKAPKSRTENMAKALHIVCQISNFTDGVRRPNRMPTAETAMKGMDAKLTKAQMLAEQAKGRGWRR